MKKYKGIVRQIYEFEIDIEAEDGADAMFKLKDLYNKRDSDELEGIFSADGFSFLRAEFSLKNRS